MPVELQDNELPAVWDAVAYFLDSRAKAKRSTMEQRLRDAKLLLLMDRVRVALDSQGSEAVKTVASRLANPEGKETVE